MFSLTFSRVEAFHFEDVFGCPLQQASFHFDFSLFLRVALDAITSSIKKELNLAWQTSSEDSMTINLGKSAASFSESDSDKFLLVFVYKMP